MEFDQAVAELDTLIVTLERDDDQRALMLLQLIDAIHRPAIELIAGGQLDHPIAQALLSMYELVPVEERIVVEEALDEIRPYIESHGGDLELLDVEDGIVHVRMSGACHGCAGSAMTLRRGIEERLRERVPGFREVVAHEPETAAVANGSAGGQLLQIERPQPQEDGAELLQIEGLKRPVFQSAGPLSDLAAGEMKSIEVDDGSILIANVEGEPYAFRNTCPLQGDRDHPLNGGRLTGTVLVCPWHNCAYDARSGKRVDDLPDAPALAVIPVAVRDGVLKVAVNVA